MPTSDSLFEIMGPVMIGPSSSHTAGAVRLGQLARNIAGSPIKQVNLVLYNSFAKTYKGHGTDRGLIAGLLGIGVQDDEIRTALEIAKEKNLDFTFSPIEDPNPHPPNTVRFELKLENNESITIVGHSIGGGKVYVSQINEYKVSLKGEYPTLVMFYQDKPGMIWQVTKCIAEEKINIASLICSRTDKGAQAFMAICLDSLLPESQVDKIRHIDGVHAVRNVDKLPS